jgi:thiazole synthase
LSKDTFKIAGKDFSSRLLVGTGKYENKDVAVHAIDASEAEIVTVAIRRVELDKSLRSEPILNYISPKKYTILPNTAGCFNAKEAIRIARLGREILDGKNLLKLEVLKDKETLLPLMDETLLAAKELVKDGFEIMVYCTDELEYALKLEEIGCVAIMPLAAPIGSGQGIVNPDAINSIIEKISQPVIIDAGIGTASEVTVALEMGCDGVLLNTAIAKAKNPVLMAEAMKEASRSGRKSYLAGRMKTDTKANPSSPMKGIVNS